jgi:N-ethylmaleimide reductase
LIVKTNEQKLFAKLNVGRVNIGHRVVMAPLTRMRAEVPSDKPAPLMTEYYAQRASEGGLIISEATTVSRKSRGYLGAPGIYDDAQVGSWKQITDVVHRKGAKMFLQLWHVGRVAHSDLIGGDTPIGASAAPYNGVSFTQNGWVPVTPNRALELHEIPGVVDEYRAAAKRALDAGFDGVELHAANGYLLDQFLENGSNKRTDIYGGSIENRARLLFEVFDVVASVWGADRVGVRVSPSSTFNEMHDSDPEALYAYVAQQLTARSASFLHVVEPRVVGSSDVEEWQPAVASAQLRKHFAGTIIAAGGFDPNSAEEIVASGDADAVAFGRHFIANPDLPARIKKQLPLNAYDRDTFYGGDARGYTDYPFYAQPAAEV